MIRKGSLIANGIPDLVNTKISVDLESGLIDVPVFNMFTGLRPGKCSAYVRKAAKELFGKDYAITNAWDRIYEDNLVAAVSDFDEVRDMIQREIMLPGMALGVNLPHKDSSKITDKHGNVALYRHILLYLGNGRQTGVPQFAHQEGSKTHVDSLEYLAQKGYKPKAVIAPKEC